MIAKAIDKIVKMTEPHIVFVRDGRLEYSDKELYEVKQCRRADGGAWKLDAVSNIIAYLERELAETGVKVIG